jgi:PPOX class probable F420-dependent enzyme
MHLPDHVRRFLEAPRVAALATIDDDGAPRQAVVWYLLDGDDVIVNSLEGRCWPTNLHRRPRVFLAVGDHEDQLRWVGLSGVAHVHGDAASAQADIAAMAHRYHYDEPGEAERIIRTQFQAQERVSFRIGIRAVHDHL